jgi:hypothetical protein
MNITAFPRRPKSPKPPETKTWCVPVNFVFDDGTELSLRLAEKSVQSLENRLWSEDNERHFVIFQTVEEVVALNARRLTHWTPDMEDSASLSTRNDEKKTRTNRSRFRFTAPTWPDQSNFGV